MTLWVFWWAEKSDHKAGFHCTAPMAPRFARKQRENCMELQAACYIVLGSNQSQTPTGDMTDKTGQYINLWTPEVSDELKGSKNLYIYVLKILSICCRK